MLRSNTARVRPTAAISLVGLCLWAACSSNEDNFFKEPPPGSAGQSAAGRAGGVNASGGSGNQSAGNGGTSGTGAAPESGGASATGGDTAAAGSGGSDTTGGTHGDSGGTHGNSGGTHGNVAGSGGTVTTGGTGGMDSGGAGTGAGEGGAPAGAGGEAGEGATGGTATAGVGGSSAGTGGTTGGVSGSANGGTTAGTGVSAGASGTSAGTAGANAGMGGSSAGSGGASAGTAGTSAGAGGSSHTIPCVDDSACSNKEYCLKTSCDAATGVCQAKPQACTTGADAAFAPVCGCDHMTYYTPCVAAREGVNVASQGECTSGAATCTRSGGNGSSCSPARSNAACYRTRTSCGGGVAPDSGVCWVLPDQCPTEDAANTYCNLGSPVCVGLCQGLRDNDPLWRNSTMCQ